MKSQDYASLVRQLEADAEAEPRVFLRKVVRIANRGRWFLALVWGAYVIAFFAAMWGCMLVQSEAFAWLVGMVFLFNGFLLYAPFNVRIEGLNGVRLRWKSCPRLFEEIDGVRKRLGIRKIHRVWLNEEMNAGAGQISRIGGVGPYRNELVLGLPLMEAVTMEEFRGILAHELAHLSRRHGRFLVRFVRLREGWSEAAEGSEFLIVRLLLGAFARWHWPMLKAHLHVLARQEELEADRLAMENYGREAIVSGKARMSMLDHLVMDDYIEELQRQTVANEEPPNDPVSQLIRQLAQPFDAAKVHRSLVKCLVDATEADESHPSLRDSLTAMGMALEGQVSTEATTIQSMLKFPVNGASEQLLGTGRDEFRKELDIRWQQENAELWRESHYFALGQQRAVDRIEERLHQAGSVTIEDAWIRARLVSELQGASAAAPLFREVLERDPAHAGALLGLGRWMLEEGDVSGEVLVERAFHAEPSYRFPAAEVLARWNRERGDFEAAQAWGDRKLAASDQMKAAEGEREGVAKSDSLLAHQLSAERVAELCDAFAKMEGIGEVWAARKRLEHLQTPPMIVLGIKASQGSWWKFAERLDWDDVERQLLVNVPTIDHLQIVALSGATKVRRKFELLGADSLIFEKKPPFSD